MRIFLDTADIEKIRKLANSGLVDGITTNPTLIAKAGVEHEKAVKEICSIVKGPVSVEGIGMKSEEIVKEGRLFASWAKNVVVKVPMSLEGMKAVKKLQSEGIDTNVTLVFSAAQALIAAKAGATYVSPFVGRLDDMGESGMRVVEEILGIYSNYDFETQVLVASVRHPMHVVEAALLGADACTVPPEVFEKLFMHKMTDDGITRFLDDWKKTVKT
ncbi:MAG: fructose-6-phosphate aldolase [Candidatus Anstonellales archaeon]